jgi:biotin carboxyl carrier protein
MEFEYLVEGAVRKIALELKDGAYLVRDGATTLRAEIFSASDEELVILTGGKSHRVLVAKDKGRTLVSCQGREYVLSEPRKEDGALLKGAEGGLDGGGVVKAPMPGKVIKVLVAEGEAVRKNQTLLIVEAMKMENEIKSGREAVVRKVHVAAGDLVDAARPLVELE